MRLTKRQLKRIIREEKARILEMHGGQDHVLDSQKISDQLGIRKRYILNAIMAIFAAAQKKSDAETLFVLGDLAIEDYPTTMLGHYFNGLGYEITGNTKKALKNYERAYTYDPIDFVTKELILNKIESLK